MSHILSWAKSERSIMSISTCPQPSGRLLALWLFAKHQQEEETTTEPRASSLPSPRSCWPPLNSCCIVTVPVTVMVWATNPCVTRAPSYDVPQPDHRCNHLPQMYKHRFSFGPPAPPRWAETSAKSLWKLWILLLNAMWHR